MAREVAGLRRHFAGQDEAGEGETESDRRRSTGAAPVGTEAPVVLARQ
jgi:hypothetical protein